MDPPGIVIALGGNALSPAGEAGTIAQQFGHTRDSLGAVVDLAAEGWRIAIVHGNGPQVGNALTQQEVARDVVPPLPLGVLVAATQGWIGYMIQQSLQNALAAGRIDRKVVALVTQALVSNEDSELTRPTKAIGRIMEEAAARVLADEHGWHVAPRKSGWSRVVGSPTPLCLVERETISTLFAAGHLVIAAGGGGAPVYRDASGRLEGIDAVVDKDRAAAVLGLDIGADHLLILTDVDAVYAGFGGPAQRPIRRLTVEDAESMLHEGELGSGTMAPKVEAALAFVRGGGKRAIIARLDAGRDAVAGRAGTEIVA